MQVEFTPSGYIFSESLQVAETPCWLEKSIFASSLFLADCAVETTQLGQMLPILARLGWVQPGYSSLKPHIVIVLKITWGMASFSSYLVQINAIQWTPAEFYVNLWVLMHWYTCKSILNTLGRAAWQLAGYLAKQHKSAVEIAGDFKREPRRDIRSPSFVSSEVA